MATDVQDARGSLLAAVLSDESFRPVAPRSLEETGLPVSMVELLVIKHLAVVGTSSGRAVAKHLCLPFGALEALYQTLRTRQLIVHTGSAPVNDYYYTLTEQGRQRAQGALATCAYAGPAPVPLVDYVLSVEAQTIRAESPKRHQLEKAFSDISIDPNLFESLGPAVNSGAGLFLYGAPGNGKSTLARRITMCFGQEIWVPQTVVEDGQLIKLYDAAYHEAIPTDDDSLIRAEHDRRWIRIRRPTVVVGGELTMDNLEIRHDPHSNISEAPLQMKSNCGCLLIDDFGRQRIEPAGLLNRSSSPPTWSPATWSTRPSCGGSPTRSRSATPPRRSFTGCSSFTPARSSASAATTWSTTCSRSTTTPRAGRCGGVIPATCSGRSSTTACTTTCPWRCAPSTSTAS
jgi:predicted ATPase with chaperone activity